MELFASQGVHPGTVAARTFSSARKWSAIVRDDRSMGYGCAGSSRSRVR